MLAALGAIIGVASGIASGIARAGALSEKIDRDAEELTFKANASAQSLQFSEDGFEASAQALLGNTRKSVLDLTNNARNESVKNYEQYGADFFTTQVGDEARSRRAQGEEILSNSFTSQQLKLRSNLYSSRVSNAITQYEKDVAIDRQSRKSSLTAQAFFGAALPGIGSGISALAGATGFGVGERAARG